jgi:hypothetical protein
VFLSAFAFESVPVSASLLRAVEVLREVNKDTIVLPKSAPTSFVRQHWAPYVMPGGVIDRRLYEFCVLSELRDRLRAGDVWVAGSRQYRSFEERLIPKQTLQDMQNAGLLPLAVEADFERFIQSRCALLDKRPTQVSSRAKDSLLSGLTIEKGVLKIHPLQSPRRRRQRSWLNGSTPYCRASASPTC